MIKMILIIITMLMINMIMMVITTIMVTLLMTTGKLWIQNDSVIMFTVMRITFAKVWFSSNNPVHPSITFQRDLLFEYK